MYLYYVISMTAQLRGLPESNMTSLPDCAAFHYCSRISPQDSEKPFNGKKSSDCCCCKTLLFVSFTIVQISRAMFILSCSSRANYRLCNWSLRAEKCILLRSFVYVIRCYGLISFWPALPGRYLMNVFPHWSNLCKDF